MIYLIITVILWGITPVIDKIAAVNADATVAIFVRGITIAVASTAILAASGKTALVTETSSKAILCLVVGGVLAGCLGVFTYMRAMQSVSDAGMVAVLTSTYPLVALALSVALLNEKLSLAKGVGSVLIVIGIFLLNF
ncbi:MAG TPA: EamA family transporter [Candidatus Ozemobacteraceae bacterium]|nr:EamA family transporter [Candidatus Ozemobacteraceae bacterium]